MTDDAAAVHERVFTIDTHCDTATGPLARAGWDFGLRHEAAEDGSQVDLPRMRAGGVDAMVWAVYVTQAARTARGFARAHALAVRTCERVRAVVAAKANECVVVTTADEACAAKAAGKRAIFLSLENSYSLGREIAHVAKFRALGVRMIGLTHMLNNEVADASTDPRGEEWGGLSPLGRELVAECNRRGIVLDASHASDETLRQMLALSRSPVVLSHSGCRAVCDHPRNIGDALLRELAAAGGVIQINALPVAVVPDPRGEERTRAFAALLLSLAEKELTPDVEAWAEGEWHRLGRTWPNPVATLADFVRHVEHAVEIAGIDHVGIGCDFDGGGGVRGLNDVSDFPRLTAALLQRGWKEAEVAKVWGRNTLRVLGAAAAQAE
ncbi:dipeptidase [Horticoccus luteus]|uniref:Dipeptidase n=1 Tax=Horticoccus luteus TaxID=2862869 RepID=A0A8F9XFE6_9BACT|nr:dipeptidase [Horticoccus luteus]QYM78007.1 dipeptidase [Horticoccus luteus]